MTRNTPRKYEESNVFAGSRSDVPDSLRPEEGRSTWSSPRWPHGDINFIRWEAESVLPESGKGMVHMASFDYGYKIAAVRDWLFKQSK